MGVTVADIVDEADAGHLRLWWMERKSTDGTDGAGGWARLYGWLDCMDGAGLDCRDGSLMGTGGIRRRTASISARTTPRSFSCTIEI